VRHCGTGLVQIHTSFEFWLYRLLCAWMLVSAGLCGAAKAQEAASVASGVNATPPAGAQARKKPVQPDQSHPPIPARTPQEEKAQLNPEAPCIQPPPMVTWSEYRGPFQKTVGLFARRLERHSVGPVHYKPAALMCTLTPKDKARLLALDTTDPVTYMSVAFNAGLSQAQDSDPTFGQGAEGYGKRFAAAAADQASSLFFKDFAYPILFREDPRYYPLGESSTGRRLLHAGKQVFVAHSENGRVMPNLSEWLGTISAASISNLYHPGNERGFAPTAENVAVSVGSDAGYNVLREFWPEIARKFRLPFKQQARQ
jgi:hypothetical protein